MAWLTHPTLSLLYKEIAGNNRATNLQRSLALDLTSKEDFSTLNPYYSLVAEYAPTQATEIYNKEQPAILNCLHQSKCLDEFILSVLAKLRVWLPIEREDAQHSDFRLQHRIDDLICYIDLFIEQSKGHCRILRQDDINNAINKFPHPMLFAKLAQVINNSAKPVSNPTPELERQVVVLGPANKPLRIK